MSNIHIDTTTEKDAVRIVLSAHAGTLNTAIHMFRAICKHNPVATVQLETTVETACELEDTIQRMLEDNTLPAAEVKVAAGVPTPTASTTFNDQLIEATRQVLLIHKKDDVELIVSSNSTISNHRLRRMENVLKAIDSSEGTDAVDYATQMAVLALNGLLILHNAKDPIRNIQAFSMAVLSSIRRTLIAKNHDYGNSFGDQLTCRGNIVYVIRMEDKIRRLRTLLTTEAQVKDESIEDTLRDIIGYCILFLHHTAN